MSRKPLAGPSGPLRLLLDLVGIGVSFWMAVFTRDLFGLGEGLPKGLQIPFGFYVLLLFLGCTYGFVTPLYRFAKTKPDLQELALTFGGVVTTAGLAFVFAQPMLGGAPRSLFLLFFGVLSLSLIGQGRGGPAFR